MITAFCLPLTSPTPKPKALPYKPKMCVLRRISDIANVAWKRARSPASFSTSLDKQPFLSEVELSDLTNTLTGVTSEHLAVHRHDFIRTRRHSDNSIAYISVAEKEYVTMSVFVMPPGSEIPLHDHPGMFVASTVLWGTLEVQEYEPVPSESSSQSCDCVALKQPVSVLIPGNARNLTPCRGNFHSFRAREWTAVFDVLLPPYNPDVGRNCNYFTPISFDQSSSPSDNFGTNRVILKVR